MSSPNWIAAEDLAIEDDRDNRSGGAAAAKTDISESHWRSLEGVQLRRRTRPRSR